MHPATTLLVLGSLPGEESLRQGRYYAHPRNDFWRLIGAVIGRAPPDNYDARLAMLAEAGVGLWDTVKSASRVGSLDAAIRDHQPNQLAQLVARLPALRGIAFNGVKASAIGRAELAGLAAQGEGATPALITLPSSSPARAIPFAEKQSAWMVLRDYLDRAVPWPT